MDSEIIKYSLLISGTLAISFFGAISGGTGLLFRPLLIFFGLPPATAVGTARVAYFGARISSIIQYHKKKKLDWRMSIIFVIPSIIGAILGTYIISILDENILTKCIGWMILLGGIFLLFKPNIGITQEFSKIHLSFFAKISTFFSFIFSNIIAATTGGAGILASYALIIFYKKTYIEAAAIRSLTGLVGAIFSVIGFIFLDLVHWYDVPLLFICTAIGNWLGVHWGIQKGEKTIRTITLILLFSIGIKMLFLK